VVSPYQYNRAQTEEEAKSQIQAIYNNITAAEDLPEAEGGILCFRNYVKLYTY
jgi:hypothetical protein